MKALKDWRSTEKKNSITKALVHILTFPETLKTIIICLLDHRDQCSMKSFVFPSLSRKVAPTIRFRHQSRAITIWLTLMGPKHSYFFSCIFFFSSMTELWKKTILYYWMLTRESDDEWKQGKAGQVYFLNHFHTQREMNMHYVSHSNEPKHMNRKHKETVEREKRLIDKETNAGTS